ncbi:unnamed protein product, partial [Closterium sp. NIES-54]
MSLQISNHCISPSSTRPSHPFPRVTPGIQCASSAYRGIGIVKLMGRQSGFIAMHSSLASGQVDMALIPE